MKAIYYEITPGSASRGAADNLGGGGQHAHFFDLDGTCSPEAEFHAIFGGCPWEERSESLSCGSRRPEFSGDTLPARRIGFESGMVPLL